METVAWKRYQFELEEGKFYTYCSIGSGNRPSFQNIIAGLFGWNNWENAPDGELITMSTNKWEHVQLPFNLCPVSTYISAFEKCGFSPSFERWTRLVIETSGFKVLKMVQLRDLKTSIQKLSGGQTPRVAIAQELLLNEPPRVAFRWWALSALWTELDRYAKRVACGIK